MDVLEFVNRRQPQWSQLEALLSRIESSGFRSLTHAQARQLGTLFRQASSNLIEARTEVASADVEQYLNDLVARAYGHIYAGRRVAVWRTVARFYSRDFPRLFRARFRFILASVATFLLGVSVATVGMLLDPDAADFLVPVEFRQGAHFDDPAARVLIDEQGAEDTGGVGLGLPPVFVSSLFTRNAAVSFLAFASGITFGVLTFVVLVFNGLILGAFAVQYTLAGEGLFFFAWVLPHGVPELTSVFIAGGAGYVLGAALLAPGRLSRRDALRLRGREAVQLVLGTLPLLGLAALIEASISQHAGHYALKLLFALALALALAAYLGLAGRDRSRGALRGAAPP